MENLDSWQVYLWVTLLSVDSLFQFLYRRAVWILIFICSHEIKRKNLFAVFLIHLVPKYTLPYTRTEEGKSFALRLLPRYLMYRFLFCLIG